MIGGQCHQQLVRAELMAHEARVARTQGVRVFIGHDQVELAGTQLREGRLGLLVDQLAGESWMLERQHRQGRDDQRSRGGLERGHPEGARDLVRPLECRLGSLEPLQHLAAVIGERAARVREQHPAADRLEQPAARLQLELAELLRYRGRRVAEGVGNRREAPAVLQLNEQAQAGGVQHCVSETNQ